MPDQSWRDDDHSELWVNGDGVRIYKQVVATDYLWVSMSERPTSPPEARRRALAPKVGVAATPPPPPVVVSRMEAIRNAVSAVRSGDLSAVDALRSLTTERKP